MSTYGAIHHLDLNVADLEGSARFYGAILTCIGYRRANLSAPGEPEGFDWMAPDARGGHRFSIGLYPARRNRPHDRYALINMHAVHEGDSLPEGARVLAITREGVVLDYQGQQFMLRPQQ